MFKGDTQGILLKQLVVDAALFLLSLFQDNFGIRETKGRCTTPTSIAPFNGRIVPSTPPPATCESSN